jgi:23S rRNA (uracil1939-C5)-methyltransferase
MGLSERSQLERKAAALAATLASAGLALPRPRWVPSEASAKYRNRLRLRIDDGEIAYFNPHKADTCTVLEPELAGLIARVKGFAVSRREQLRPFAHAEVRSPDSDSLSGLCFYPRAAGAIAEPSFGELEAIGSDVLVHVEGSRPPELVPRQRRLLAKDVYCYVPLDAFVQVNTRVNLSLCASLRSLASCHAIQSVIDLYAGSGNLTLPLLRDGIAAVAVESHASAAYALRLAADVQQLGPLEVVAGDAKAAAADFRRSGNEWDLLVVDAPRAGAGEGIQDMAPLARRHIALVSCNPKTLARDLARVTNLGFELQELLLFDMFAQTRHVEVLAWLSRAR